MNRKSTPIPEPIAQLQCQLDQFRSTHPRRTKLPESLWQVAVELAREHGVYSVAHPLRLDYMRLKKQLGGVPTRRQKKATKPTFVELISPPGLRAIYGARNPCSRPQTRPRDRGSPDDLTRPAKARPNAIERPASTNIADDLPARLAVGGISGNDRFLRKSTAEITEP
jgi:hypothetical protein